MKEQWALPAPDTFLGRVIEDLFERKRLPLPSSIVTTTSTLMRLNLMANGRFLSVMPTTTFKFLGFLFICGKSHRGQFLVHRKSRRDRMQAKLKEVKQELRKRMHQPIPEQGRWLAQVVRGYFAYHAVPTNRASISAFRRYVVRLWHRTLRRRSQKDRFPWERMPSLADDWLPQPRNFHPWPHVRFAVKHSR
jgi:RNA-directed DNA polymerase